MEELWVIVVRLATVARDVNAVKDPWEWELRDLLVG